MRGRQLGMDRINQFAFYELGRQLQSLKELSGDVPVLDAVFKLFDAHTGLGKLLKGDPMPLGISRATAEALDKDIDEVVEKFCLTRDGEGKPLWPDDKKPPIPSWRWGFLVRAIETFETVFSEEMREATTYFVPRRGSFHTPALVDSADQCFPKEIAGAIPEKTKADWRAAGRCLAFNLLSAAGFHIARAVEATLESYYQAYSGKSGVTLDNWGQYLQHLETIQQTGVSPAPSDRTLAELRQMKDDFRNPIIHPRVVLDECDAKILFNNGESLIIGMAQEIAALSKGAQLVLIPSTGSQP